MTTIKYDAIPRPLHLSYNTACILSSSVRRRCCGKSSTVIRQMMSHGMILVAALAVATLSGVALVSAFAPNSEALPYTCGLVKHGRGEAGSEVSSRKLQPTPTATITTTTRTTTTSALHANNNFFDDLGKFFDDLGNSLNGGWGGNDSNNKNGDKDGDGAYGDDEDEDEIAAGTFRVAKIPVKSIKPGGLRLFLMFYLMGMQNTPTKNAWRANQPATDDYLIDYWYHDQSAVLTIHLKETAITIDRTGSNPSTAYMMQETVILDGILNELDQCAFDEEIDIDDRLLVLPEPQQDAIERARDALAFG